MDTPSASQLDWAGNATFFLSWSGPDSQNIAAALADIIQAVFNGRIRTWQSTRDLTGIAPWRTEIQQAVQHSRGAVLVLGTQSLRSSWLHYEAGAFFREGATFILGCGVDQATFRDSPLHELQLWDAQVRGQVRQLVKSMGVVVGDRPDDFDLRFDAAWGPFEQVIGRIRAESEAKLAKKEAEAQARRDAERQERLEVEARARRRRRHLRIGVGLFVVVLALGLGTAAFWPDVRCALSSGETAADCTWSHLIADEMRSGEKAKAQLNQMISRRPFAVLVLDGADPAAPPGRRVHLVRQGWQRDGLLVTAIFAKSNSETADFARSVVTVSEGDAVRVLEVDKPVRMTGRSVSVALIDSLSDNRMCSKLMRLRRAFAGSPALAEELTAYLADFKLGGGVPLRTRVDDWLRDCPSN